MRSHDLLIREPAEATCGSSVVLRNQTMTVANDNSAGAFSYRTFQHFLQQKKFLYCDSFLFSFVPGRTKLARFRAEVGRDSCSQSSQGQEGHRHCL